MQTRPVTADTVDHLPIADITDDILITRDGGAAVVLSSSSLNFSLLSEREQNAVLASYAALLNSLSFPIQIVVRSDEKDVTRYLAFLEKTKQTLTNPLLSRLMGDYAEFISHTVKKKRVLEKQFLVIIPFSPLELGLRGALGVGARGKSKRLPYSRSYIVKKAKTAIYPKRDHLLRQAARVGVKLHQLTTEELTALFHSIYRQEEEVSIDKTKSPLETITPDSLTIDWKQMLLNDKIYSRTLFVAGYPRFVSPGWLDPIINFDHPLTISFFIYPVQGKTVLDDLRRKIAEMEAEIATDFQRGKILNPGTQAKLEDALSLQEELVRGAERFFQFAFYINIPAASKEELENVTQQVKSTLGALLVSAQPSTLTQEEGFISTLPIGVDKLMLTRNMDTSSLSTTFPFVSAELSQEKGIVYGINEDNGSLVVFDRWTLENANSTVFGTAGGGKSYMVKLETVRYLMLGAEVIIIDPESEYKALCEAVGGQFISFSFGSNSKINPFDLPVRPAPPRGEQAGLTTVEPEGENALTLKLISLHSLFKVIMGQLNPIEEAILDQALVATYKGKGITPDPSTHKKEPPLLEDLYKALIGMERTEAISLAARLEKFVKGSFVGIFDQPTTVDIKNPFTVFSIRDLEEALRPIAMFIVLDFIWTRVRQDMKRRLLVVDEAWHMMKFPDSALFLWSVAKRARKYWVALTTITQDVQDFLSQDIGRAIVTNAAMHILMKQSAAAIDNLGEVFHLSEGEKQLLLSADIGEGIFFAGPNHVAIRVVASDSEHKLVTTKPEELFAMRGSAAKTNQPISQNTQPKTNL